MNSKITLNQIRPFYQYLRQQAEKKKVSKYIEITATFTLVTIFLFFAIKPTALAISSLVGEIKSKELASQKMSSKINSILQAQDSFAQAQEKYSILESGFPSNPNFYQAAVNFSSISEQSSVDIKQLSFNISQPIKDKKKSDDSLTKSFQVNLFTESQYQQSLSLIKELIGNRRLIDISSIKFSRPENKKNVTSNQDFINLSIISNLFYSPIENEEN
jgi:hypothetical protein